MLRRLARIIVNTSRTRHVNTPTVSLCMSAGPWPVQPRRNLSTSRSSDDESSSRQSSRTRSRTWKGRIFATTIAGASISLGAYTVSRHYRPEDLPEPLQRSLEVLDIERVINKIIPESKAEEVFKLYNDEMMASLETVPAVVAEKYPKITAVMPRFLHLCFQVRNLAADSAIRAEIIGQRLDEAREWKQFVYQAESAVPDSYRSMSIEQHAMAIVENLDQIAQLEILLREAFEEQIVAINSYSDPALDDLRTSSREMFNSTAEAIAKTITVVACIHSSLDCNSSLMIGRSLRTLQEL